MGSIGDIVKGVGTWVNAKNTRERAERTERENRQLIEGMDWEPEYASNLMGADYQKSQSPLADGYLNSILTGNNPAMTFSGSPNAGAKKYSQQQSQNAMYGTPEARQKASAAIQSTNPYSARAPSDPTGFVEYGKDMPGLWGGKSHKTMSAPQGVRKVGFDSDMNQSDAETARNPEATKNGLSTTAFDDIAGAYGNKNLHLLDGGKVVVGKNPDEWKALSDEDTQHLASLYAAGDSEAVEAFTKKKIGGTKKHSAGSKVKHALFNKW